MGGRNNRKEKKRRRRKRKKRKKKPRSYLKLVINLLQFHFPPPNVAMESSRSSCEIMWIPRMGMRGRQKKKKTKRPSLEPSVFVTELFGDTGYIVRTGTGQLKEGDL
jgi:hypothetical protein